MAESILGNARSHSSVSSLYRGSPTLGPFAIASSSCLETSLRRTRFSSNLLSKASASSGVGTRAAYGFANHSSNSTTVYYPTVYRKVPKRDVTLSGTLIDGEYRNSSRNSLSTRYSAACHRKDNHGQPPAQQTYSILDALLFTLAMTGTLLYLAKSHESSLRTQALFRNL